MKRSEGHILSVGKTPTEDQDNACEAETLHNERLENTNRVRYSVPQISFVISLALLPIDFFTA